MRLGPTPCAPGPRFAAGAGRAVPARAAGDALSEPRPTPPSPPRVGPTPRAALRAAPGRRVRVSGAGCASPSLRPSPPGAGPACGAVHDLDLHLERDLVFHLGSQTVFVALQVLADQDEQREKDRLGGRPEAEERKGERIRPRAAGPAITRFTTIQPTNVTAWARQEPACWWPWRRWRWRARPTGRAVPRRSR